MSGQSNESWACRRRMRGALATPMTATAWAIALSVCALILATPAQAAVFVLNSTVDSVDTLPGDGVCGDASGACTLRAAVMEANALAGPDIVRLPAGTYVLVIPGTDEYAAATGDLDVTDDLTLVGAGAETTIIDADGIDRVLSVVAASLSVHSLTITGGLASDLSGGGILCVACDGLSVTNSTISGNVAEDSSDPDAWMDGLGGGVALFAAQQPAAVSSTTISGNQAENGGGGVAVISSELMIRGSSISENISNRWYGSGGGILTTVWGGDNSTLTLVNSTVSGNVGAGAAITGSCEKGGCYGGDAAVYSSTISGNTGGGIHGHPVGSGSSIVVRNSVIADHASGPDCDAGVIVSGGHNIDTDGSCGLTDPTDFPNTNPMLGPLQDNGGPTFTYALLPGSPAIDAVPSADCIYDDDGDPGTPEVPLTKDQRGVPRPRGDACDIGAYEVTACADGINNDTDAFTDLDDPGCRDATSVREDPQCQDGINNDPGQDPDPGMIDFDGGISVLGYVATDPDPQCVGKPWKNKEKTGCGLGAELALLLPPLLWLARRRRRSRKL